MSVTTLHIRPRGDTTESAADGWAKTVGYANGVGGPRPHDLCRRQIGWTAGRFEARDLPGQVRQALANIVAILASRGRSGAHHAMTFILTDRKAYSASLKDIGSGLQGGHRSNHFPTMAVVEVSGSHRG